MDTRIIAAMKRSVLSPARKRMHVDGLQEILARGRVLRISGTHDTSLHFISLGRGVGCPSTGGAHAVLGVCDNNVSRNTVETKSGAWPCNGWFLGTN